MEGRSPRTGEPLRRVGGDGSRVAGIDATFIGAEVGVGAVGAVRVRIGVRRSRSRTAGRSRAPSSGSSVTWSWSAAASAASCVGSRRGVWWRREFVHTSSRLTRDQERDGVPDPQLHSHVVVLAAQREDGRFAAVDSRELFRSQRANGAWYRAELAHELRELGLEVRGRTGRDGRFFELAGVPEALVEAVVAAWRGDRARGAGSFVTATGATPHAGELGAIAVATRGTKTVTAEVDVSAAWRAVGEEYGLEPRAQAEAAVHRPDASSASATFAASCSPT